jgi:hypothetical protein
MMHAEVAANDPESVTTSPHPFIRLVNDSKSAVPLTALTARYYYSKEPSGTEAFNCYWVSIGDCPVLAPTVFADATPKTSTADRYMQLSFVASAPTLAAGDAVEIHDAFYIANYPSFTQTNDYSFVTNSDFVSSEHLTIYRGGVLIWGVEP